MDLDPRRLAVLAAVARTGGVLAAAQALRVTPSAVSQQVARLEREAGVALVVRGGRRLTLTAAGAALAERGERITAELAGARTDLAGLTDRATGPVTLVAFPTAISALVGWTATLLRARHSGVALRVIETAEEPATERLRAGSVDVVIVERDSADRRPTPAGLRDVPLLDDPYILAVPGQWPRPRTVADLAESPWVGGPAGSATHSVLERVARAGGWHPDVAHEALEFPAVLALVTAGLGCALLPRLALTDTDTDQARFHTAQPVGIRSLALPGLGARRLLARHRASRNEPSPAVAAVVQALMDAVAAREVTARPTARPVGRPSGPS